MSVPVQLRRVLVGAVLLLTLAGCDEAPQGQNQAGDVPAAGTAPVSGPGQPAQGADTLVPAQQLDLSGSANGVFTTASKAQCSTEPTTPAFSWSAQGSLNGSPVDISYNTNNYRGPGSYNVTGITDDRGGQMVLEVGDPKSPGSVQVASNGDTRGTFTIGEDQKSGTLDTELTGNDNQRVRIKGSWKC